MNQHEEEEIKVEYFESFDLDPLRENSVPNTRGNIYSEGLEDTVVSPTSKHENIENCLHNEKLKDISQGDGCKNMIILEATWYKTIDNFGRYLCRFCDLTYSTVQTLRHHIKTKHSKHVSQLRTAILNNKRKSKLKCHICKKRFNFLPDLEAHVQTKHMKYMNSSCTFCHATFEKDSDILTHMLHKHGKIKSNTYSCSLCGYQTSKVSHFKQHVNTHDSIKSKKCKHCDYSTNYSPNLKIHERIHLDIKPYFCDFKGCDYRSSAKSALRSHQLKHDPDNNLLYCDKCMYKTVYIQSLKKHIDSHNRNNIRIAFFEG